MHMKNLILLAAVANNNVIGNTGKTPWHIPEEMKLFKTVTMGHTVLMGRKTYESIGHPLPGRTMIILSRTLRPSASRNLIICPSIPQALSYLQEGKTAFVIGGGEIYAQMMPLTYQMKISHLKEAYEGDCFFPPIDPTVWKIAEEKEFPTFIHSTYVRI